MYTGGHLFWTLDKEPRSIPNSSGEMGILILMLRKAPMTDYLQSEEFLNRSRKLGEIREHLNPYPASWPVPETVQQLLDRMQKEQLGHSEEAESGATPHARIAGRIVLLRSMGKNCFLQIQEEEARIQLMFNRDHSKIAGLLAEESAIKFLEKKLDLGDIIGVEGNLFYTQKGELTLYVKELTLLCKTLLPLPDKHSGLQDKEVRYRKRWLDMLAHKQGLQTFVQRSKLLMWLRQFFHELNFLEVETPILQNFYGGAEAAPFITHLNALDKQQMFLRISLEPSLKKLIVGGHLRVFEIGKAFRNEGIDKTHNPEFTMIEAYAAYWDYKDMMRLVETLFETLALKLHGSTVVRCVQPKTGLEYDVDFKAPWKAISMKESLKVYAEIDVDAMSDEALCNKLLTTELDPKEVKKATRGRMVALLFEEFVEQHLIQPHHIFDHPIETTPLCKPHRDEELRQSGIVERFESFVLASEVCNAYTELNDPILQRELLEAQTSRDSMDLDEEFLEAIYQGMPPTGGVGIGIDRLVMLLTGNSSIRDVLYFPLMKRQ